MSFPIQISTTLENYALGVSTSQSDLLYLLETPLLPGGGTARFIKIDNIGSVVAFVRVAPATDTILVPGGFGNPGNCFPVMPLGSVTIELIPVNATPTDSPFNEIAPLGPPQCWINAITNDGTTIIVVTPVQPVL